MTAADIERIKELLPTELGSGEIRSGIAADILRRSVFSAQMASASYLAKIREVCTGICEGTVDQASARERLLRMLASMGHSMQDKGGLRNPASIRRLNLIIDTQRQMASSVQTLSEQTEGTVAQWPAWELRRLEPRSVPRADWPRRWREAGESVGWEGALKDRFIALKNSPVWQALGDGAGGFKDTLGNPYPPFAYASGLDWVEVDRDTCSRLGLECSDAATPEAPSLSPGEREIAEAADRYGFDFSAALGELEEMIG